MYQAPAKHCNSGCSFGLERSLHKKKTVYLATPKIYASFQDFAHMYIYINKYIYINMFHYTVSNEITINTTPFVKGDT